MGEHGVGGGGAGASEVAPSAAGASGAGAAGRGPRRAGRRAAPPLGATARTAASRARVDALCRDAVAALTAAAVPHDVTHLARRRRLLRDDVLVVVGTGWDLGRYVLWPDATLRAAGERLGWVDETTGAVRLRGGEEARLADGAAVAAGGGVWAVCEPVAHVDVAEVGDRCEVVVADDGVSRWADHPHGRPDRRHPGSRPRPVADWPDLAVDLPERVRRRTQR
ncbi:hypothetical protein [uncultured Pseudokineococcus sp.]|uniref:hypothetical protein n=1 Tax=uncultured Pseudokineococcus sp. TaxID=1642928 RepID=UPI002610CEA1|nr:hypothetical protein [uncultured Pseudokineococcus sp.]